MNKKTEIVNYELDPDPETAANLVKPKEGKEKGILDFEIFKKLILSDPTTIGAQVLEIQKAIDALKAVFHRGAVDADGDRRRRVHAC